MSLADAGKQCGFAHVSVSPGIFGSLYASQLGDSRYEVTSRMCLSAGERLHRNGIAVFTSVPPMTGTEC